MTEQQKSELSPQKKSLKLSPALGDWTTYKPQRVLIKRVKAGLYGFDRLSKDELEKAHRIHYHFAEKLCNALRVDLGLRIDIYSVDALQNNYSNFFKLLSQPLAELSICLPELNENAFLSIDLTLANTIINSLLGSRDHEVLQRELTEAESSLLETGIVNYQPVYNESFSNVMQDPKFKLVSSPHPNPSPSVSPNSSFVYFVIEAKLNESYGKIVFGYSSRALKALIKKIKESEQGQLKISRLSPAIAGQASQLIKVFLGSTMISSGDIRSIEPGDVLLLDQSIFSALPAKLDGKEVLLGQPGIKGEKLSFKIVSVEKDRSRAPEVKVAPPPVEEEKTEELPEEELPEEEIKEEEIKEEEISEEPFYEETMEKTPEEEENYAEEEENEEIEEEGEEEDFLEDENFENEDFGEEEK